MYKYFALCVDYRLDTPPTPTPTPTPPPPPTHTPSCFNPHLKSYIVLIPVMSVMSTSQTLSL